MFADSIVELAQHGRRILSNAICSPTEQYVISRSL